MKLKFDVILIALLTNLTYLLISCTNSNVNPNINYLKLDIAILDKNGNEKFFFNTEDDISLALIATNVTEDTIELCDDYYLTRLTNENKDFFLIYKIVQNNEKIPIGKPFILPIDYGGVNLPVKISPKCEQYIFKDRWLDNPNNALLESGNYYSGFSIEIKGKVFKPEISFTVQ